MLTYEMISKNGDRKYNEDSVRVAEKGGDACFVLADGLGGHGGGDEASRLVVECVIEQFHKEGLTDSFLQNSFELAQSELLQYQEKLHKEDQMKTTLVILVKQGNKLQWGHIGDSRLYCFGDKKYELRTLDHSVPQMLVAAGQLREKAIRGHSDRNRLLRVMGTEWDKPEYQIADPIELDKEYSFLLCSDGFWELIVEKDMEKLLKKAKSPREWIEKMEKIVLRNGKNKDMDNYSVIAVSMSPDK